MSFSATMRGVRPRVLIKKLRPDAVVPRYMTAHAAGLDLSAALDEAIELGVGKRVAIPTGLAIKVPEGYEAQVRPRSGLAREHGVTLVNSPGTIDADYTGPLVVLVINHGDRTVRIEPGQRIAQLVVAPVVQAELCEVDQLPATARGAGGFGSTGR
jgi:dUTP pyrophosphatase